jgi:hypothetical protein
VDELATTRIGLRLWLPPSWTRHWSLLIEPVPYLMHCIHDDVACGVGSVAKVLADVTETAANMVLAKIIACRVKIPLRTGAVGIAGGKGQRQGQQAQAGQSHINGFLSPLISFIHEQISIFWCPFKFAREH